MKKLLMIPILASSILYAKDYQSSGSFWAGSKTEACKKALEQAKENALAQAGTFIISDFSKSTQVDGDKYSSIKNKEFKALTLGTVKVKSTEETVEVSKDYQFNCKVDGVFNIDEDEMKKAYQDYIKKEKKAAEVFEAVGYSEEGQSRFRAFKAAEIDAKRNLVELIKGSDLLSRTDIVDGKMDKDVVINSISGNLRYVKIVSRHYDPQTRSAEVKLSLSYEDLKKQIENY